MATTLLTDEQECRLAELEALVERAIHSCPGHKVCEVLVFGINHAENFCSPEIRLALKANLMPLAKFIQEME